MNKKLYTGELTKPMQEIYYPPSREGVKKAIKAANQEEALKLLRLYEHYGINLSDENAAFQLNVCLARKHVNGFKRIPKAGAKTKWNMIECNDLKNEVDKFRKVNSEKGISGHQNSKTNAFNHFAKKERWMKLTGNKAKPQEIKRQYHNADPNWLKLSETAWDELLQECKNRGIAVPKLRNK